VPLYDTQVEFVLQLTQTIRISIYDGNVVVFTNQVFGECATDLTGAKNDYFHFALV
jgi:hypothetical protein